MLEPFHLEGAGVHLEPLSTPHVEALAAAAEGDRASFAYTWVPDGLEDARRYVDAALVGRDSGREVPFAVRRLSDGRIVGSTRFMDLDIFTWPPAWPPGRVGALDLCEERPPSVAEIGSTWYSPDAQQSGVNAAAKLLLLTHAFDVWGVQRVTFKTDARNAASRGAIERLGARFEGVRRVHVLATDGTGRDSAYYSIVTAEWPELRAVLEGRVGRLG